MAAFSFPNHPFLIDSVFFPQFYPSEAFHEVSIDQRNHESSYLDHSSMVALSDNEPSDAKKQSTDSSTVIDKLESGEQVTQKMSPMNKKRKNRNGSLLNSTQSKDERQSKPKKQRKTNEEIKNEEEDKKLVSNEIDQEKAKEEPPKDYIHVRARRGQATDSHSLAERVRREKISERMKMLQKIVPGCDKVTGKALMLDEIINYVRSLQNQVELLSMKLISMNPMFFDFGMDLDELMVRPEKMSTSTMVLPTPFQPQCTNYPLLDSSTSVLLQQEQCPNTMFQDNGGLLWDVEDQRENFFNLSDFSNNFRSFK